MPRKRSPKLLLIKKQELIASRLMQISLKVDDYIYKDIPIPATKAAGFITEVCGYKDACYGDKRSLQVIEKLVRCMKGIIAEQREPQIGCDERDDVTLVDIETILASSVDEDMTQFTQEVNQLLESSKNNFETANLDDETVSDIGDHFNGNETNLSNKRDTKNKYKRDGSSNEQLQRAISNLTIGDNDDPLTISALSPEVCSQSILYDFDAFHDNISKTPIANNIVRSQDFEAIIQPVTIAKKYNNSNIVDCTVTNIASIDNTKNSLRKNPKTSRKSNSSFDPSKLTAPVNKNSCEMNKHIIKSKKNVQRKRRQKSTEKPNKNDEHETKQICGKKNKQKIKESLKCNAIANKTLDKIKNCEKPQKSIKSLNRTVQNKGCNQRVGDEILSNPRSRFTDNSVNAIYNNDTENDLSWIENIRFVREIDSGEKIQAYFEESFWENFMLPNNWNNDDFLYT